MNGDIPSWEEWNEQLTQEQRHYSLYKILQSMDKKLSEKDLQCKGQIKECRDKFEKLEKRKAIDKGYAVGSGFIGGFVAMLAKTLFK